MQRMKHLLHIPVALAFAALAMSCVPELAAQREPGASREAQAREMIDEAGRRVVVPAVVRRIVSLAPNLTETVYALGAQDRLAGVTNYCDYPAEALRKPKVGGAQNPSLEAVVALKPDLVLATTSINRLETVQALERLGIAVYATDPRSVEGVIASIRHVADVIGAGTEGGALATQLEARLGELKRRLAGRAPKRIFFVVWESPLITMGQHTFLADAVRWAGGESIIEAKQDWPQVSIEEVIRQQPDHILFTSSDVVSSEKEFEELSTAAGWKGLNAVQQRHIAIVSDAIARPAPRLVDAIEQLARELHPDAFAPAPENKKEKVEDGK